MIINLCNILNIENSVISWFSKYKSTITLFSYKAKYIDQTQAIKKDV